MVLNYKRGDLDWMLGGNLYLEVDKAVAQAAQKSCECSMSGDIQGCVGWGPGKVLSNPIYSVILGLPHISFHWNQNSD